MKMQLININDATDAQLNYLIGKCEGHDSLDVKEYINTAEVIQIMNRENITGECKIYRGQMGENTEPRYVCKQYPFNENTNMWEMPIISPILNGPSFLHAMVRFYIITKLGDGMQEVPDNL